MPFGKYKGTPFTELDHGYLKWLEGKLDEWRPPLRAAIEAEIARRATSSTTPASSSPRQRASATATSVCTKCGLPSTTDRPLMVHQHCADDGLPF
jgi:hypothetical protein